MVVTKIEAGKYSIVTASGAKFEVTKQFSHCWNLKYTKTDETKWTARTLKECIEVVSNYAGSGEHTKVEKSAEPVTPEEVAKTDGPADTEKTDEPKSNIDRMMPDFLNHKIAFNAPTQELCDLFLDECVKRGLKWGSGELINRDYPHIWLINGDSTCIDCYGGRVGYADQDFYTRNYPSIPIVTLTPADFDKPKKEFTKADLKTGMVVECRNGSRYMVIEGKYECESGRNTDPMLIGEETSWEDGSRYHDDLVNDKDSNFNIDKVYKRKMQGLGWMLKNVSGNDLIWQRKPEYDWSKAEVDMPMLGRHGGDAPWRKRYFAKYENGIVLSWSNGCTSWTTDKTCHWAYALPYKGNEHLVEGESK